MKLLAVILIAQLAGINADDFVAKGPAEINKLRAECQQEHNVSAKELEEFKPYHLPENKKLRAFVYCIGNKMSMFGPDAGFVRDHLSKQLGQYVSDDKLVENIIQKCVAAFEPDGTKEYARNYFNKSFDCMEQDITALLKQGVQEST